MVDRAYNTTPSHPFPLTKRQLFQQNFYVHHPLLERMIQHKLNKCLQHGHERQPKIRVSTQHHLGKVKVIEAPCIIGNSKTITLKTDSGRRSMTRINTRQSRPKSQNTVIRSRTSEPRIRQKLQSLARDDDHEQSLKPTLNIRRYLESRQ